MTDSSAPKIESESKFDLPAMLRATGWNSGLQRTKTIQVNSELFALAELQVCSVNIKATRKVKTKGYTFPESPSWSVFHQDNAKRSSPRAKGQGSQPENQEKRQSSTRILPPKDTIKLQDRLYYLLQPPLETILDTPMLELPFRPFPYQLSGIGFLYSRHSAILADEMGLGKTMQAITTIRLLLHAGELQSVMLICPKPLVSNWKREFKLWAPEIPIAVVEGDQATRAWKWRLPDVPVKIANYELMLRDQDDLLDGSLHFDLIVLDEAQRIKNRLSNSSKIVRQLNRTRSWALTGTPIENCSDDLVGIFEFLSEGYLHPGMTTQRLQEATCDYILRRTKDKVLTDMPPKMYRDASINLSPEQSESYRMAEDKGVIQLKDLGESITIQHVFELVLRLKQICNFDPATNRSSKLDRLEADLEEVASSGKKAIVFSQWVKTIDKIKDRLQRFNPLEYHGKIPSKKRDTIIDQFKEDPDCSVILMSYGAGSVGLNLQFCEYVFLFDRWWNPAIEDQAINRAHRIGAAGTVTVTRFMAVGTIEERIDQVLSEKRDLFESILSNSESPKSMGMTQKDIFGLFNLSTPAGKLEAA